MLCRALKRYDLPRMLLNLKAAQRSEKLCKACLARLKACDPRLFVFLDETHVDEKSTRRQQGRVHPLPAVPGERRKQRETKAVFSK